MVQKKSLKADPEKEKRRSLLQKLCIFYVTLWSIAPPLQIDMPFRLAALGCVFVWFAIEMSNNFEFTKFELAAIAYAVEVIAVAYIRGGTGIILKQISIYMFVLLLIVNRCYGKDRWKELGNIHIVIILLLTVFNFITYSELTVNPEISRLLVRDTESLYTYYRKGVGGYSLIYPQICIAAVGFQWAASQFKKSKWKTCVGIVWIISLFLLILEAGYSIAIVTFAISFIILALYRQKNPIPAITIALALFILMLYAIMKSTALQNFLLEVFDGTAVTKKINDFISSINDAEAEGSIQARLIRYEKSFFGYLSSPIIGSLTEYVSGGHSAILDAFAVYGLMGIVNLRIIISEQFKELRKKTENKIIVRCINAAMVAITFVCTLDSATYQFAAPIMIIIPLFLRDIETDDEKEEKPDEDEDFTDSQYLPYEVK